MEELYMRLCELEDRHARVKNNIYDARVAVQLQKDGHADFNKGRVAQLLVNYKNELDQIKKDVNETIRLAGSVKTDTKPKDPDSLF